MPAVLVSRERAEMIHKARLVLKRHSDAVAKPDDAKENPSMLGWALIGTAAVVGAVGMWAAAAFVPGAAPALGLVPTSYQGSTRAGAFRFNRPNLDAAVGALKVVVNDPSGPIIPTLANNGAPVYTFAGDGSTNQGGAVYLFLWSNGDVVGQLLIGLNNSGYSFNFTALSGADNVTVTNSQGVATNIASGTTAALPGL